MVVQIEILSSSLSNDRSPGIDSTGIHEPHGSEPISTSKMGTAPDDPWIPELRDFRYYHKIQRLNPNCNCRFSTVFVPFYQSYKI